LMLEILARCAEVEQTLTQHSTRFDELRDLVARAPEVLTGLERSVAETRGQVATARGTLERLRSTYRPAALASVADNPEQAEQLLSHATTAIAESRALLAPAADG